MFKGCVFALTSNSDANHRSAASCGRVPAGQRRRGGGRKSGQRHLTPLVGRDEEIAILMRRWERARRGNEQLVLIVGEPGLGKSRLIEEFHARRVHVGARGAL